MKNRSKFENEVIRLTERISGNKRATPLYKKLFKKMSDKDFKQWVQDLLDEKTCLMVLTPNGEKGISMDTLQTLAEEINYSLYTRVWLETPSGLPVLSDHKPLYSNMPMRRLSQALMSKMIVAHDDHSVDSITGQPTKRSTGNSLSSPEIEILASSGLSKTASELHNIRGGDEGAYRAYKALLASRGQASFNDIAPYKTGVKSSKMVNTLFVCAMISPA